MDAADQPEQTASPAPDDGLTQIVTEAVDRAGLYLEEVTVGGSPGHRTLHVMVDHIEGVEGVELDTVAQVSARISAALDAAGDELPGLGTEPYQLEVTSPGTSRSLTEPRHWRRNEGRMVSVSVDGGEPITARITAVDGDGVELTPLRPGAKKGMPAKVGTPQHHAYHRLGPGAVQVELGHGAAAPTGDGAGRQHTASRDNADRDDADREA